MVKVSVFHRFESIFMGKEKVTKRHFMPLKRFTFIENLIFWAHMYGFNMIFGKQTAVPESSYCGKTERQQISLFSNSDSSCG